MKHTKITDHIYGTDIILCIGEDKEFISFVKKNFTDLVDVVEQSLESECLGLTCLNPNTKTIVIYFWNNQDKNRLLNTVTHELFHATHAIMTRVGIKLSDDSEEAYAYLIGYLTQKTLNFLQLN